MIKQLELNLNKRLLIVEYEAEQIDEIFEYCKVHPQKFNNINGICKFICKGSEFNEEIAKGLVNNILKEMEVEAFENYNVTEKDLDKNHWAGVADTALESFISAIENAGYYWGENPIEEPNTAQMKYVIDVTNSLYNVDLEKWQEAESRTFDLEKTLIFEIL